MINKMNSLRNRISNLWFNLSDKIRFVIVGGFNACVSYCIFSLICLVIGENFYQTSLAMSWIITSVISFTTQRLLVFNTRKGNLLKQYIKCCTTWFFSYLINAGILEVFVQKFEINVYISQILATFCSAIFTYIMFKVFAFKNGEKN